MQHQTQNKMEKAKQKVEELGVLLERFGRSPLEARIFALLLIAEPPHQSFDEIREFLGASKSAVSNALNFFLREKTVAYKTFSGDRKRYFYINAKEWERLLEDSSKNMFNFNVMLRDVLDYRKNSLHKDFNKDIKNVLKFQEHISNSLETALKKWNKK